MEENVNEFWIKKRARIEILKDQQRLIYTATILELDSQSITFKDRDGEVFSFPRDSVKQMQQIGGGC